MKDTTLDDLTCHSAVQARLEQLSRENDQLRNQIGFMRGLALRDQLTGLYSRRYLTDYLEQEIAQASATENVAIALCDIDDFKNINDVRGHRSGDIAIVCISDILDDLAAGQPVIRWGGEELLVVLFATTAHEAWRLCDEMRQNVAQYPIRDEYGQFSCTLTFGVASYDTKTPFADNFARIDHALYQGKSEGKNRCILARDGGESTAS